MSYSKEWKDKILQATFEPGTDWEEIYHFYHFDDESIRQNHNLVVLTEGVWIEISEILYPDRFSFEKVRGVTTENLLFDGSSKGGFYSQGSLGHIFRIDGHELDLVMPPKDCRKTRQELLLEFIREVTGVSDRSYPKVPEGILKLPESF